MFMLAVGMGRLAVWVVMRKAHCLQTTQAAALQIAGLEGNTLPTAQILPAEVMAAAVFWLYDILLPQRRQQLPEAQKRWSAHLFITLLLLVALWL